MKQICKIFNYFLDNEIFLIKNIKNITGIPKIAVSTKKNGQPIISTIPPAYPAINLGKNNIIELNKAY